MDPKNLPSAAFLRQRQQLTQRIRFHAAGARSERLHPRRVRNAVECGRALSQLKELLRHGDWNRWVKEKCGLSKATASRYMRLASRTGQLTRYMTIREAYIAAGVIAGKRNKPARARRGVAERRT